MYVLCLSDPPCTWPMCVYLITPTATVAHFDSLAVHVYSELPLFRASKMRSPRYSVFLPLFLAQPRLIIQPKNLEMTQFS